MHLTHYSTQRVGDAFWFAINNTNLNSDYYTWMDCQIAYPVKISQSKIQNGITMVAFEYKLSATHAINPIGLLRVPYTK